MARPFLAWCWWRLSPGGHVLKCSGAKSKVVSTVGRTSSAISNPTNKIDKNKLIQKKDRVGLNLTNIDFESYPQKNITSPKPWDKKPWDKLQMWFNYIHYTDRSVKEDTHKKVFNFSGRTTKRLWIIFAMYLKILFSQKTRRNLSDRNV